MICWRKKKSLRPPSPLPGKSINQPSRPSQRLTGRSEGTTQQQHFSPNKTAAVRETIIIKMNRQNHRHRIKTTTFRHNDSLFRNGQLGKDSTESIRHIYPSVYSRPQKKTLGGRFLPQPVNLLDLVCWILFVGSCPKTKPPGWSCCQEPGNRSTALCDITRRR